MTYNQNDSAKSCNPFVSAHRVRPFRGIGQTLGKRVCSFRSSSMVKHTRFFFFLDGKGTKEEGKLPRVEAPDRSAGFFYATLEYLGGDESFFFSSFSRMFPRRIPLFLPLLPLPLFFFYFPSNFRQTRLRLPTTGTPVARTNAKGWFQTSENLPRFSIMQKRWNVRVHGGKREVERKKNAGHY